MIDELPKPHIARNANDLIANDIHFVKPKVKNPTTLKSSINNSILIVWTRGIARTERWYENDNADVIERERPSNAKHEWKSVKNRIKNIKISLIVVVDLRWIKLEIVYDKKIDLNNCTKNADKPCKEKRKWIREEKLSPAINEKHIDVEIKLKIVSPIIKRSLSSYLREKRKKKEKGK